MRTPGVLLAGWRGGGFAGKYLQRHLGNPITIFISFRQSFSTPLQGVVLGIGQEPEYWLLGGVTQYIGFYLLVGLNPIPRVNTVFFLSKM